MMKKFVNCCGEFCSRNIRIYKNQAFFALLVILSIVATIALSFPSYAQTTSRPQSELRGVWLTNIDSNVLFERNRLNSALQQLKELNFNTVYPTVWNWGYTLYPSRVAQAVIGRSVDPTPGLQKRDMLRVNQMLSSIFEQFVQKSPVSVYLLRNG